VESIVTAIDTLYDIVYCILGLLFYPHVDVIM